ncbi:bifunctional lysylphosphatidylglycerol flippase/synthetase MprF [Pseudobacillus wudalianchiensis]|uniref:Phosphatidylglycerol lysyltransferase n=1 Tax=Pseudobacillus wudalianchiensis TaxID=1743143 RepID=A0A1B9B6J6_9BACI|nr:bifunctional lysylphosphatidylglycerol flippase/synthetase MprF [Bacillus wudalianchiensis]OCA91741.1 lysylphosphatidylglycerol synthetase [Bacillus wudalianchiensis]
MLHFNKEKFFQFIKVFFPIVLFILAAIEIKQFVNGLNINLIRSEIKHLNYVEMTLILFIPFCGIFPMFFYDAILVKILNIKIETKKLIKQSFITNSFSNLIGFGGLVGVMLRTYFYNKYGTDKRRLLTAITSVSLFYLTGISLFSWVIPAAYRDFPLIVETKWLFLAVLAVGLYLPLFTFAYFYQNRKGKESLIHFRSASALLLVSLLEWAAAFSVIWLLSAMLHIPLSFHELVPVFIVASCAGIASMIPGGLGSFDLVFIWGTQNLNILDEKVLVMLIFYRAGYFLLPFLLAAALFVKEYWKKWNQSWDNLPNAVIQNISHVLLTILVFISGLILLLSAAVPGILERIKIAHEFLSFPIMNLSHQLSVAAGFMLLGLSRGINYNVKRTYQLTMIVLGFAALFSLFKGIDYEEAIFMLAVALLLKASQNRFYRESYVLTWGKALFDLTLFFVITSMYLLIGYWNLPSAKLNVPKALAPYIITNYTDLFFSAAIGLLIAFFILAIGYLIRKPKQWIPETSAAQEEEILHHLDQHKGNVLAHLIFLHDKYVYWNEEKTVLFSYQKYADKLVILGNPIGKKTEFPRAIEEFMSAADLYGYTLAFYEVTDDMLPSLHEYGYDFFKLGEEAAVDLESFTLSGKKMKGERAIKNKFEREQYRFEMIDPPFSKEVINELNNISHQWLQGREEKGFSLGFFDEDYLNKSKIAVVKTADNHIMGFASMMPVYDKGKTISIDLMRFRPDAPAGTMDFIFLSLFEWSKEQGYRFFHLGMAPLSNVGTSRFSFLSEKIAAQIFLHGQIFYQFQGLKRFKEKYTDLWEAKYLAYRKKSSLPFTMAQITFLISKKRKAQ